MVFHLWMILLLSPWLLLSVGAVRRVRQRNTRLRRLQVEGAIIILLALIGKWVVYDPNLGLAMRSPGLWTYWFARGEAGFMWVGLLIFGLGYFLERRPGPGLIPWPAYGKRVCGVAILCGATVALIAWHYKGVSWGDEPFSQARLWFSAGCLPFGVGYNIWTKDWDIIPEDLDL